MIFSFFLFCRWCIFLIDVGSSPNRVIFTNAQRRHLTHNVLMLLEVLLPKHLMFFQYPNFPFRKVDMILTQHPPGSCAPNWLHGNAMIVSPATSLFSSWALGGFVKGKLHQAPGNTTSLGKLGLTKLKYTTAPIPSMYLPTMNG